MGGRKRVSGGALAERGVRAGRISDESGISRMAVEVLASGRVPQWHWQPEDLQQSCLRVDGSCVS